MFRIKRAMDSPAVTRRFLFRMSFLALASLFACEASVGPERGTLDSTAPQFSISDAVHGGGE